MHSDFLKNITVIIKERLALLKTGFNNIKENIHNLEEVNLNLALKYLNDNKLEEAFTRFKIMHLLWPENIDATYYYSLLLILSEKNEKAVNIINKSNNKDDVNLKKMLYVAENKDMRYILDIIDQHNIRLSEIKDVL